MDSEGWYFDKMQYKVLKREHLKRKHKEPKGFIIVKFFLPFELPFEDYTRSLFEFRGETLAVLIKDHEYERNVYMDMTMPDTVSEVEIVLFSFSYLTDQIKEKKMHEAVDFTLEFLQRLLEIIMILYESQGVRRITRQDLPYIIPVKLIQNTSFKEKYIEKKAIMNMHFNSTPIPPTKLNTEQINTLTNMVNESDKLIFKDSVLYMRESKQLLGVGNYREAVINLETSIELFMYTFYRLVLINKEKLSGEDLSNKLNGRYTNILNHHLKKVFSEVGRIFDFNTEKEPQNLLNDYKEKVYLLRNKIVHEGYRCTESEANEAYEIGKNMLISVTDAINSTTLKRDVFLGEELVSGRIEM